MSNGAPLTIGKAVILGATGPTGFHLAAALRERGAEVRAVSRKLDNLERVFGSTGEELHAADALDADATARAIEGFPFVFDCIGLPGELMHQHPATAQNIADAVRRGLSRCVQVSSYWAYLPLTRGSLDEDHPRDGGPEWARLRREAEDILQEAGAAVLNLPDFFGPHVHTSVLQNALAEAAAGKTMNWMGPADVEREHIYAPDAMELAVRIAEQEDAYGRRWILPGSGPLTANQAAEIASAKLGRQVKVRAAGPTMLRLVSLFNAQLRAFLPMVPDYVEPIAFDASRLKELLDEVRTTPYRQAIGETLDWITAERAGDN